MLTTAKALGGGFPCSALLMTEALAHTLKSGDLGTTFGGGPMACALVSTVIEVIQRDRLMDNVRTLSAEIRRTALVGPAEGIQGRGFLLGLRCRRPAKDVQAELLERERAGQVFMGEHELALGMTRYVLERTSAASD